MFRKGWGFATIALCAVFVGPGQAAAQLTDTSAFLAHLSNVYRVVPNVTYHVASNQDNKFDLYLPQNASGPVPVLMYIHGGGWVGGTKESSVLRVLPYLESGWAVVNVEYRLGRVAPAPAAVEDCLCALRWVVNNADEFNFDTSPDRDDGPLGRWPLGPHDGHDSAVGRFGTVSPQGSWTVV